MLLAVSSPSTEAHVASVSRVVSALLVKGGFENVAIPIPKELLTIVIKLTLSSGKGAAVEFLRGSLGNAWLVTHSPLIDLIMMLYKEYPWVNLISSGPSLNDQRRISKIAVDMVTLTAKSALTGIKIDDWVKLHRQAVETLDKPRTYPPNSIVVSIGYVNHLKVRNIADDVVVVSELKPTPTELFYIYRGNYDDRFRDIVKWVIRYLSDIVPSSRNLTEAYITITRNREYLSFVSSITPSSH
ncbi:hypothetical protein [Caldivirga maquilingensis]|uniref:Uncharacterized protein n=1 Tax=Caldivirga maquilingensis (strain ATCC 700844 / DSM 13496 / JCM 10307 / IC-167) TaxID=397948 RepID=A8MCX0_CALMQ|nr:hypothetical protein [Caldivirga maquilingensis]ABW01626.1 hypothetical protein Cmaq_0791 [Caldivirga maquilingensis IC-167]